MSDTPDVISREELERMVLAKAVQDPAFAERLKADPKAALSELLGAALPDALTVHVFQETPTELLLRLPMVADGALSEAELGGVAGGIFAIPMHIRPGPGGAGGGGMAIPLSAIPGFPRRRFPI